MTDLKESEIRKFLRESQTEVWLGAGLIAYGVFIYTNCSEEKGQALKAQIITEHQIVERLRKGLSEMEKFMQTGKGKYKSTFQPYVDLNQIIKELQSILNEAKTK